MSEQCTSSWIAKARPIRHQLRAVADPERPRLGLEGIGMTILAEHGRTDDPGLAAIVRTGAREGLQEDVPPF